MICLATLGACTGRRQAGLLTTADEKLSQSQYADAAELLKRAIAMNPTSTLAIKAQSKLAPKQRVREAMRRHFESYRQEARIMG